MMTDFSEIGVVVLGGGPDRERAVSLASAGAVFDALRGTGRFREVTYLEIDRLSQEELRGIEGDLFFPVLHGSWGEGGPLQELLEKDGRPFVGSGSESARVAMDKLRSIAVARALGIDVADSYEFDVFDDGGLRIACPVVVKPIDDGSSVNIFICETIDEFDEAVRIIREGITGRDGKRPRYMVERYVAGRELTVSVVGHAVSSIIEIIPQHGFYDYDAKYERDDTCYIVNPDLPDGVREYLCESSLRLFDEIGARDLARVDYRYDGEEGGEFESGYGCYFLEINTMPGFTGHSLLPMGAKREQGWDMGELCCRLVGFAAARSSIPSH